MSVLFCLSPGRVQRPLPEGEVQPPQGVCDPGLPDGPMCQPQAPAPQVKAGGRECSPSGGSGGAPSLTGGQEAEAERVFVPWFHMGFGTCTPAVVLRHRFAKNVSIFISFTSTLLDSEPSSEQRNRKPSLGHYWHCPSSQNDPRTQEACS